MISNHFEKTVSHNYNSSYISYSCFIIQENVFQKKINYSWKNVWLRTISFIRNRQQNEMLIKIEKNLLEFASTIWSNLKMFPRSIVGRYKIRCENSQNFR